MGDAILPLTGLAAAVTGLSLLARVTIESLRRRRRRYCPGPRPPVRAIPWPLSWFHGGRCLYDLSGHAPAGGGAIRCPECSCRVKPGRALRASRRVRPGRVGLALLLAGAVTLGAPAVRARRWTAAIPTALLALTEWPAGNPRLASLRREVGRRVDAGDVGGIEARLLAASLVRDLRDDDVRFNAHRAMGLLRDLGVDAVPALERALRSDDRQQSQMAAAVLRNLPAYAPCEDLVRVTIEGLRDDALPFQAAGGGRGVRYSFVFNARDGLAYLVRHGPFIEPYLVAGLESDDEQQRLLSAVAAGLSRLDRLAQEAVPILLEHLKDNGVPEDATMAAAALLHFGPEIAPLVERHWNAADPQQRKLIRGVLAGLREHGDEHLAGPFHTTKFCWMHP